MAKTQIKFSIFNFQFSIPRREFIFLVLILLLGAFLRLYRISEYMTFLGDEGRDAIVVRRLLVNFDPILVGPGTSIGDMYLGPLYYYMMAPALLLANFSPVGPAVMIALLGVVTIFFVWYVGREWFGGLAGLIAAGLYAIAPTVIVYSRSSWNPNIMPFFALLCLYSLWRVWQDKQFRWLVVAGVSMAFVLQSHYLGLLLVPTLSLFWLLSLKEAKRKSKDLKKFINFSLASFLFFAFLMSPLVIFDARHGWRNFASMKKFFLERQTTVSARPWTAIPKLPEIVSEATSRLITGTETALAGWVSLVLAIGVFWILGKSLHQYFTQKKLTKKMKAFCLLFVWLAVAFIGLGVYKQEIYDHYYGFFFAAPFLLIGGLSSQLIQSKKVLGSLLVVPALAILIFVNLNNNPLKYPPNRQLQRTIEVAKKIIDEAGGEKFNLAVIAERNYEGAYQYFLEKENAPIVMIDPQRADETIAEQLFVVCELPAEKCDPVNNPKAEIANFGWSKVEEKWQVAGTTLFKLVHVQ